MGLTRSAPPGWSFWRVPFGDGSIDNTGYTVGREDGTTESPGEEQTPYFAGQCAQFVREAAAPWFLWFCPNDPHYPLEGTSARRRDFSDERWPVPDFSVVGKPPYIRAPPVPDESDVEQMQQLQQLRLAELGDLDRAVEQIWSTVDATGQADRTTIVFTSDNGNSLLDHRLPSLSKGSPYDACMRVPLIVVGPGFEPGATVGEPVAAAQDLTATVLDVCGAEAPIPQVGLSLLDIVGDSQRAGDRRLLGHCDPANGPEGVPPCDIVVTGARKLTRYRDQPEDDRFELYDVDADPEELVNLADDGRHDDVVVAMDADLDELLGT